MIQGDEPLLCPRDVEGMLTQFNNPEVEIVNLMVATDNLEFIRDRNNVKVVFNNKMDAMYFSREPCQVYMVKHLFRIGIFRLV